MLKILSILFLEFLSLLFQFFSLSFHVTNYLQIELITIKISVIIYLENSPNEIFLVLLFLFMLHVITHWVKDYF